MSLKLKWVQAEKGNSFGIEKRELAIPTKSSFPHPIKKWLVDEQSGLIAAKIGSSVEIGNYDDPILSYAIFKIGGDLIKILYDFKKQDGKDGVILIKVDEGRSIFPEQYYKDMDYAENIRTIVAAILPELYPHPRFSERLKNCSVIFGGRE